MKQSTIFVFSFLAGCALFEQTSATAADCDGKTRQEHHVGNFNFVTSSWIEKVGHRRRYVTCVANLDAGTDLWVNWFIPGPYKQYVPATEVAKSPRLRDDTKDRPIDGCFAYGGLQTTTIAQFLGTTEDEANHRAGACGLITSEVGTNPVAEAAQPLVEWVDDVQVFFPSDLSNPHDSMLVVTGQIGIIPKEKGFVSYFNYYANRYGDREKGNVEDVTVRPVFPGEQNGFLIAFANSNLKNGEVSLSVKGSINFEVTEESQKWRSVAAFYEFRDRHDQLLAAIPMPLFGDAGE